MFSRLIALSAGVMLDTIIFSMLLMAGKILNNEIFDFLSVIMFLRIIWQFRFHRKTDGKYFLMMILDNPLIDIDYKNNKMVLTKQEILVWRIAVLIGITVDLYFLVFWIIPIIYRIILYLGEMI